MGHRSILPALAWTLLTLLPAAAAAQVLDVPLPPPGEERTVAVPPDGHVRLAISPGDVELEADGQDLRIHLPDGGSVVLEGLLAEQAGGAVLEAANGARISGAELRQVLVEGGPPEAAVGAPAPAGLLGSLTWLATRLGIIGEARAQDDGGATDTPEDRLLAQVRAQLAIARDTELLALARSAVADYQALHGRMEGLAANGRVPEREVEFTAALVPRARIALEEATLALSLSVDAHEDAFGARLNTAPFPDWEETPPETLADLAEAVAPGQRATARGQWRRWRSAGLRLEHHRQFLEQARDALALYREAFDLGQAQATELAGMQQLVDDAQAGLIRTRHDRAVAQAYLLWVTGELTDSALVRPGWQ